MKKRIEKETILKIRNKWKIVYPAVIISGIATDWPYSRLLQCNEHDFDHIPVFSLAFSTSTVSYPKTASLQTYFPCGTHKTKISQCSALQPRSASAWNTAACHTEGTNLFLTVYLCNSKQANFIVVLKLFQLRWRACTALWARKMLTVTFFN